MTGEQLKSAVIDNWHSTVLGALGGVAITASTGGFSHGDFWSIAAGVLMALRGALAQDGGK